MFCPRLNEYTQERKMRHIKIAGWVLVPLALAAVGLIGYISYIQGRSEFKAQCDRFVNESIINICADWNSGELLKRAEPDSVKACDLMTVDKVFKVFSKLGSLKKYYGCEGEIEAKDDLITYFYIAVADFEMGRAIMVLQGSWKEGVFYIGDFKVKSEALLKARHELTNQRLISKKFNGQFESDSVRIRP